MSTMADKKPRRTRRSFSDEYKTGAVRLVLDEGKSVGEVSSAGSNRRDAASDVLTVRLMVTNVE